MLRVMQSSALLFCLLLPLRLSDIASLYARLMFLF